jgi:SAM-dependent methyltransferase
MNAPMSVMPNMSEAEEERAPHASRSEFLALLRAAVDGGRLRKLVLAKPDAGASLAPRVELRAISWRGAPGLSFTEHHATRDLTSNATLEDGLARVEAWLAVGYAHAHLYAADGDAELRRGKRGGSRLLRRAAPDRAGAVDAGPPALVPHDRVKRRWVDVTRPWLVDLGVTDAQHRVIPAMARKWRQIDKFVEIVDHAVGSSELRGRDTVRVVDFGAGKGYLTFAVHDHLVRALGKRAEVVGVERRAELVDAGNAAAQRAGMAGLRFEAGDIAGVPAEAADVVIALHACDTATDEALYRGVRARAAILVASPCCHQELRAQILPPALLQPMLRHGIHLGQEAEMVTDALRALLLEREGYAARVFEFVSLEHTTKNKMILAVRRRDGVDRAALDAEIDALEGFYGVRRQRLQALLAA